MKLLISACLLGEPCRYDGGGYPPEPIRDRLAGHLLIPVCPERLGGLPTPRSPAERRGERVFDNTGKEVTSAFLQGAEAALALALREDCRCALLKERSPSCGNHLIYDGSFTGRRIPGEGMTAGLLRRRGIAVFSEEQLEELLAWIAKQNG